MSGRIKVRRKPCVARTPLRYGSKACSKDAAEASDLCDEHRKTISPHQLINGTLYIGDDEDDS